jgi:peptidoglycan hydrolase-like protein with peptidoglycan-binding domain
MMRRPLPLAMVLLAAVAWLPVTGSAPASAQTATAPNPLFDAAKTAADTAGVAETAAIQRSLILTGDLNALATGEYGKRTFEAIKAFQKRTKAPETGILLPAERKRLDADAAKVSADYGLKPITERGTTLLYPAKIVTKRTDGKRGPKFSAPKDSVTVDILFYPTEDEEFAPLFERLKKPREGRTVTYSLMKPEFFVIAGTVDGKSFYMRFLATKTGTRGFVVGWDPKLSPDFDRVPVAMASSLEAEGQLAPLLIAAPSGTPGPSTEQASTAAAPSGPPLPFLPGVVYAKREGLGVVVSAKGDVLTTADLVVGCETLAVTQGGTAKVIAGDLVNNLALVRLEKPGPAPVAISAVPLAEAATLKAAARGEDGAVTQAAAAITATSGPNGDARRFLAAGPMTPGFLFDETGGLISPRIGVDAGQAVGLRPLFVSAFLRAQGVALAPAGGDAASAVVGLACDKTQQ